MGFWDRKNRKKWVFFFLESHQYVGIYIWRMGCDCVSLSGFSSVCLYACFSACLSLSLPVCVVVCLSVCVLNLTNTQIEKQADKHTEEHTNRDIQSHIISPMYLRIPFTLVCMCSLNPKTKFFQGTPIIGNFPILRVWVHVRNRKFAWAPNVLIVRRLRGR